MLNVEMPCSLAGCKLISCNGDRRLGLIATPEMENAVSVGSVPHDEDVVDGFLFLSFSTFDDLNGYEAAENGTKTGRKGRFRLSTAKKTIVEKASCPLKKKRGRHYKNPSTVKEPIVEEAPCPVEKTRGRPFKNPPFK